MLGYEIGKGLADLPVEFMIGTVLSLAILAEAGFSEASLGR